MFDKFVIIFFYIYLSSKFFSETIKVIPKMIDLVDLPVVFIFFLLLLFRKNQPALRPFYQSNFVFICFVIFTFATLLALLFNYDTLFMPSAVLYFIGFLGGPVLFYALDRFSKNKLKLIKAFERMIYILLFVNMIIVVFVNIPAFILTGNPDVISGTYGNNQYVFSFFVVLVGTYFLGLSQKNNKKVFFLIATQAVVFLVYYLLQYRAGLPFFVFAYTVIIYYLYKAKSVLIFIIICFALALTLFIGKNIEKRSTSTLDYDTWIMVLEDPYKFLNYTKFTVYPQTLKLFIDEPVSIFVGVGPGNYLSRAHYTFAWDFVASYNRQKGVGPIIEEYFGRINARFSPYYLKYISSVETGFVIGTAQFSNPHSSFLSPIAESGLFGGIAILTMYAICFVNSIKFLTMAKDKFKDILPLSVALVGCSCYLAGLIFLDNYLEMLRVTMLYWFLYWAVSVRIEKALELEAESKTIIDDGF